MKNISLSIYANIGDEIYNYILIIFNIQIYCEQESSKGYWLERCAIITIKLKSSKGNC